MVNTLKVFINKESMKEETSKLVYLDGFSLIHFARAIYRNKPSLSEKIYIGYRRQLQNELKIWS